MADNIQIIHATEGAAFVDGVRPVVLEFAAAMERVLRANEYKGGWEGSSNKYLFDYLCKEVEELANALDSNNCCHIQHEAIDAANLAMMLWDNNR